MNKMVDAEWLILYDKLEKLHKTGVNAIVSKLLIVVDLPKKQIKFTLSSVSDVAVATTVGATVGGAVDGPPGAAVGAGVGAVAGYIFGIGNGNGCQNEFNW
ncbi:unnamed protein product [Rotaria sordida]|uniref:Glycine zipper domain-containing protein n=1 Tax=Rotaria sordida TaxID=392033 RepID=A0A819A1D5_9BILA|nr:unnamed protein product [Rotaria sordida]CAF0975583.1 unnamed protein product [Rotaria sordida]CAF3776919.1 unnamed protein product [Rotaria sordida]CAF3884432.1 unnamed protein product [Rotaria sordida]